MYEAPRVPADNPHYRGIRIREVRDLLPGAFSTDHLSRAYASLADSQLILESPPFDEVDSYFNPGIDIVSNDMVLEAITVDKFSRTEKRMAAMVRVLNRHLADSEITALDPVVGKPRKTGQFAFVTVQLPFSDGQTVSVIFHAPEGDRKKIGPSDTIIAFRWLLNKRDITQVVAPEEGVEISLETIAKRITQLVAKNTARFEKQQKGAQAERKELDATRQTVKDTSERQAALMGSVSSGQNDLDNTEATLAATLTALEKQKTLNAELEAKIDALKKARAGDAGGGGNETPPQPQPAPAQPAPAFLSTLAEISAGKYDHEGTTRIGDRIDEIMDPMDDAIMKQYETELNAALDHLTVLLKEKAAKYL